MVNKKIGIIGAGAWGTALAVAVKQAGHNVTIWSRNEEVVNSINTQHENTVYLKGVKISPEITATNSLEEVSDNDVLVLVIPAQTMREYVVKLSIPENIPLVIASKGIEQNTFALMSEVVEEYLPNPVAVISGPNFAKEVAQLKPAATTIACSDKKIGEELLEVFGSKTLRPYLTDDIIGVQVSGAIKNIIAIACGISAGRNLGENAKAAIITRSLAEISRLCIIKGGKKETLMGLAGIGDLMLTCSSMQSRNCSLGYELGQGKTLEEILKSRKTVTEGVATAKSVFELSEKLKIEMPICEAVYDILYQNGDIEQTINNLIERPYKTE